MSRPTLSFVVCAAGVGARTGFSKNKLLVPFQGECALVRLIAKLQAPIVDEIILSVHARDVEEIKNLCRPYDKIKIVLGGETRSQSVYNALNVATGEVVLIHDGARPFVDMQTIEECYQSVLTYGSGICAIPASDTVAIARGEEIESFPNRSDCYLVQTPQGFFLKDVKAAYEKAFLEGKDEFTDDSSLYAAYAQKPRLCRGAKSNIKLTFAEDFLTPTRVGFGVDTHAFGKEQDYVVLGGVKIPSETGLIAHSDGDVLLHAVMDALLSAVGLRDIGYYFPDSDMRYKGADSSLLTQKVVGMVKENGYCVHNISIAIQAEKPRLAKYIDEMRKAVATLLEVNVDAVDISAGTNEGLGYVGEGKGITVQAYASLRTR
ncbi:MAG: 2-C-methyl-D-erythritol 2,4-cyclodiphosphate synthase [Clostridia bacterium]|nr:2-C-methyl-D-erythritol 2,4-cyclodiphosphate synthase [Clostridia bacterium]